MISWTRQLDGGIRRKKSAVRWCPASSDGRPRRLRSAPYHAAGTNDRRTGGIASSSLRLEILRRTRDQASHHENHEIYRGLNCPRQKQAWRRPAVSHLLHPHYKGVKGSLGDRAQQFPSFRHRAAARVSLSRYARRGRLGKIEFVLNQILPTQPMFLIKICGITTVDDAVMAADAGADAIGLNFCPQSPRYVAPDQARRIADAVAGRLLRVGVMVNPSEEEALALAGDVGLDVVQLHGK